MDAWYGVAIMEGRGHNPQRLLRKDVNALIGIRDSDGRGKPIQVLRSPVYRAVEIRNEKMIGVLFLPSVEEFPCRDEILYRI
jgi:hypothetical protein